MYLLEEGYSLYKDNAKHHKEDGSDHSKNKCSEVFTKRGK